MTRFTMTAALMVLTCAAGMAQADENQRGERGQRGKNGAGGQERAQGRGQGGAQGGARRGSPGREDGGRNMRQQGEGRADMMDPQKMVARMMDEFDNDGDRKLDEQELTKLLSAMRERMRGGANGAVGNRQGQGRPGAGDNNRGAGENSRQRPEGNERGGRRGRGGAGGAEAAEKGGDKPARPGKRDASA